MFDPMEPPDTRAEFERRFFLLGEQLRNGKLSFPGGSMSVLGLREVRMLPNGRIDFLSVNEFARLQANMIAHMQSRWESIGSGNATESGRADASRLEGAEQKRGRSKRNAKRRRKRRRN